MKKSDTVEILSPSNLNDFLACRYLVATKRTGAQSGDRPEDSMAEITRRRGLEHEATYLERLRVDGLSVVELTFPKSDLASLLAAEVETVEAMARGVDVIYQANFFDGTWRGHADFLRRVDAPSSLGVWSYEPVDTKLARSVKTSAILQLCSYAEHITRIQERAPEHVRVVTGDGTEHFERLRDYDAYFRSVRTAFEAWHAAQKPDSGAIYPEPVAHCTVCDLADECAERRRTDDHLSLVANLRLSQAMHLRAVGIGTVEALGTTVRTAVPGLAGATFEKLHDQARLQIEERREGHRVYELLPLGDGAERGLALLPEPSRGDVFFDMEGDPFIAEHGLEYLFGLVTVEGEDSTFTPYWAHTSADERTAFEATIDLIIERLDADPNMHVYHYAPYEPTALFKLMGRHGARERELDRLLRAGVFVDLYRVVRQSIRVSSEGYSIKDLEPLYMAKRDGTITDAGSSVVAYEEWLETEDTTILDEIAQYNEADCVSTWLLRDWLEARRAELEVDHGPLPRPVATDGTESEAMSDEEDETAALAVRLRDLPAGSSEEDIAAARLFADLLPYHRREAKAGWFWLFRRSEMSLEELFDDHEAISGLEYQGDVGTIQRSVIHRYSFDPRQQHKVLVGDSPVNHAQRSMGTVVAIDPDRGTIDLRRGRNNDVENTGALIPGAPVDSKPLSVALRRVATGILENGFEGTTFRAAADLLQRRVPHLLVGPAPGSSLTLVGESGTATTRRLVPMLEASCLAVQGPPGTGKTYTGAHTIVDLIASGKRVGITALGHKAIGNLLTAVMDEASARKVSVRALQKCSTEQHCGHGDVSSTSVNADIDSALADGTVDLVAGTAWLFCREQVTDTLDYLFVDEAAQLALANVIAASGAARNLVLLGDPQQLTQPSQGSHPDGVDTSALAHLLGEHDTIPDDLGVFLAESHRMHPDVCDFISELAYEDRLSSVAECANQLVSPGGTGLRWVPVQHEGNTTRSAEEATVVAELVAELLHGTWTNKQREESPLSPDDILVVTPFNAQAQRLRAVLGEEIQVGTVDKFQGREAPVVIYSMACSSADDVPRGIEVLYDLHRFNVAVSRAQGLVYVVASPALLTPAVRTLAQMRAVNGLCRYEERARDMSGT